MLCEIVRAGLKPEFPYNTMQSHAMYSYLTKFLQTPKECKGMEGNKCLENIS
jgi:hypothetical protein